MKPRYEVQRITDGKKFGEHVNFRITDKLTDSRIATCYSRENADFIVARLNSIVYCRMCGVSSEGRPCDDAGCPLKTAQSATPVDKREGFYEKLWKDFCSLQRGHAVAVVEKVERYYREQTFPSATKPTMPDEVADMLEALTSYEQADHDGVFVKVSRQACDEAADLIRSRYIKSESPNG